MGKRTLHAHEMVWETAKALALDEYETIMQNNSVWAAWKEEWLSERGKALVPGLNEKTLPELYQKLRAPKLLNEARKALALCLTSNNLNEEQKSLIHNALVKDNYLKKGRGYNPFSGESKRLRIKV